MNCTTCGDKLSCRQALYKHVLRKHKDVYED